MIYQLINFYFIHLSSIMEETPRKDTELIFQFFSLIIIDLIFIATSWWIKILKVYAQDKF